MSNNVIIVDTNILFSLLLRDKSHLANHFWDSPYALYICETALMELFKHKEKIIRLSQLTDTKILQIYHSLIKHLHLYKEELIEPSGWQKAYDLCKSIDEADTPHVALTLHLKGLLWTGDKRLSNGLKTKGFKQLYLPDLN